ncbi:MAG: Holliday junction branch migration protein RuvA [Lachnospiraceae bacterium]
MISFLKGIIEDINENSILMDVRGVGYEIYMPAPNLSRLPGIGEEMKIHTYLQVSENGIGLYGFLTKDDLKVFKLLITVNGIGPKGAAGILSYLSADELRLAVLADDARAIAKAPGIGPKTAKKLILELKDKFHPEDIFSGPEESSDPAVRETSAGNDERQEAIQALVALGYSNTDALKAVRMVEHAETMSVEEILKASLKHLAFL